jgi:putative ABC transport system permease protein
VFIIQNAIKNLGRNKGRNILMGVIVLAIILTTSVSLIINTTAAAVIKDYKERFGSQVYINLDIEKLMASQSGGMVALDFASITYAQYQAFAQSEYLKAAYFQAEFGVSSESLKAIDQRDPNDPNTAGGGVVISGSVAGGNGDPATFVMPTIKILGYSTPDMMTDFKDEQRKITQGVLFQNKGECIVSEDFAALNGIKVGDTIEVQNAMNTDQKNIQLKVTGIYFDATSAYGNLPFKDAYMNRRNEILTNVETVNGMDESGFINIIPTYYLKNPSMLADFDKEVRSKGLPDTYKVSTDEATYNAIVGPVEGMSNFSLTFLIVVLVLGSIILILLSAIAIRERKYEIGVLRAMGMKKGKVALGLLSEMLVITTVCLVIGLSIGAFTAQPVADMLLKNQIAAAQQGPTTSMGMQGVTVVAGSGTMSSFGGPQATPLAELKVGLTFEAIWQITAISLLLAGVASLTGISFITKYEPIKILSERN